MLHIHIGTIFQTELESVHDFLARVLMLLLNQMSLHLVVKLMSSLRKFFYLNHNLDWLLLMLCHSICVVNPYYLSKNPNSNPYTLIF